MSAPDTLTLADLRTRTFPHPSLGVLGDPIAHSLSPAMHNAALAALRPTHPTLVRSITCACILPPPNYPRPY
ncbi:hypothetical protein EMGBS8_16700 [Verrucomicrobiota bacterium]|nr:hypothetical protein EMGBS8_16700 [Verrucomicrobiota bacterium]